MNKYGYDQPPLPVHSYGQPGPYGHHTDPGEALQGSAELVIYCILLDKIGMHWKQNQQSVKCTGC